jgi:hypothetical protein
VLLHGDRARHAILTGSEEVAAMGGALEVFRRNAIKLDELLAERAETAAGLEKTFEEWTAKLAGREATLRAIFDSMLQGVALFDQSQDGCLERSISPIGRLTGRVLAGAE